MMPYDHLFRPSLHKKKNKPMNKLYLAPTPTGLFLIDCSHSSSSSRSRSTSTSTSTTSHRQGRACWFGLHRRRFLLIHFIGIGCSGHGTTCVTGCSDDALESPTRMKERWWGCGPYIRLDSKVECMAVIRGPGGEKTFTFSKCRPGARIAAGIEFLDRCVAEKTCADRKS